MDSSESILVKSEIENRRPLELTAHSVTMVLNCSVADAYHFIQDANVDFLAAVDNDGRLQGLLSRAGLGKILGTRFGYPLFGNRPASSYMSTNPLVCRTDSSMLELIHLALSRPVETLLDDVVVVDNESRVCGLIPYHVLVGQQLQLVRDNLQQLREQKAALENKNRELEVATLAALESAKAKSNFLATMSHELRTPMNGVLGMLSLLDPDKLDSDQAECIQTARESGESLLKIINDILDLSKLDAGRIEPEKIPFDLARELISVQALLTPQAVAKGLSLTLDWNVKTPGKLIGDPNRLRQILLNLLGNALKFTNSGGVRLVVDRPFATGTMWSFAIIDTGIGIPEGIQPALFQPFVQADSSTTRKFGGTGLGLSISQQLITLLGGSPIILESQVGKGSIFRFSLPFADAPPATAIEPTCQVKRCALVVDDMAVNRLILEKRLRKLNIHCLTANDGEQALNLMRKRKFDIVFMDCHMPVMDGPAAVHIFRQWEEEQIPTPQRTPIVAVSADTDATNIDACRMSGMDGFIAKPIGEEDLVNTLSKHFSRVGDPVAAC